MKIRIQIIVLFLSFSWAAFSQCVDTLSIGNDTTICAGTPFQLKASNGYFSYYWSTGSYGKFVNVTQTGDYWVKTTKLDTTNLVVNGGFTSGNTGFTTNYTLGTGGSWGQLSYEGTYAINTNPINTHTNFASCTDHTTGTGNMMVVNGSATLNTSIWCQTVSVTPNTNYIFSAWFTSVVAANPAVLNFNINGNTIGGLVSVSPTLCTWQNFYQTWNSGANTSATICIKNQNTAPSGNDFALDDIYFAKICTFYDTVHVNVLPYPIVNLGPDTSICEGDTLLLKAGNPTSTHLWHDGSTSSTHTAFANGTQWVQVNNGPCKVTDTIHINTVQRAIPTLGKDTVFCEGTSLVLNAGPGALHVWNTGSYTQSILADTSGTYIVKVYPNFIADCPGYDTVILVKLPQPNLGNDTCVWNDALPFMLTAGPSSPNLKYNWSNAATTNTISIGQTGTYSVTVKDNLIAPNGGCSDSKNVFIGIKNDLILSRLLQADNVTYVDLGSGNQSICDHQLLRLIAPTESFATYNWKIDGNQVSTTSYYVFKEYPIANYLVELSYSNGCDASINVNVHSCILTIPNIITPNGDGVNDVFEIVNLKESFPNSLLYIYDRWGKLIYSSTNYSNDWNGEDASDGVYYWVLKVADNKDTEMQGNLTILRK